MEAHQKTIEEAGGKIVAAFKNEHGEPYIIFWHKAVKGTLFIAGSETDWEWMQLYADYSGAIKSIQFSTEEKRTIRDLMKKYKERMVTDDR